MVETPNMPEEQTGPSRSAWSQVTEGKPAARVSSIVDRSSVRDHIHPAVFAKELKDIRKSRSKRDMPSEALEREETRARAEAAERLSKLKKFRACDCGLVGLALSGGGIRSASVCLGVLQALAQANKLRFVDYLSTVSGGGYIGSSWSALAATLEKSAEPDRFPFRRKPFLEHEGMPQHGAAGTDAPALQHVRDYANYLVPNGVQNYLEMPAILLRGLIVNALLLLPYILIAASLTLLLLHWLPDTWRNTEHSSLFAIGALIALFALFLVILAAFQSRAIRQKKEQALGHRNRVRRISVWAFLVTAFALVFVVNLWILFYLRQADTAFGDFWNATVAITTLLLGAVGGVAGAIGLLRSSPTARRAGLLVVALLGPLALWIVYAAFMTVPYRIGDDAFTWYWSAAYLTAAILFRVINQCLFDVNATSLFWRYRDALSSTFIIDISKEDKPKPVDRLRLSELKPEDGGPYHLINATLNAPVFGSRQAGLEARGRRADAFLFSKYFCGNDRITYAETRLLEVAAPQLDLATAMAASAAAVSARMGQKTLNPLFVFLLAMLNVRLGFWLPSPQIIPLAYWRRIFKASKAGPLLFLAEAFGLSLAKRSGMVYVTDGGHYDNIALLELLRRRCAFVIVVDADADPRLEFADFAEAQRLAATDLGVRISIDFGDIRPDLDGLSQRHMALGRIDYGDGLDGEILYIKSSLTGTEPEFIKAYKAQNPLFPHQSTLDQFFDEPQFEAYRALGEKIGHDVTRLRDSRLETELPEALPGIEPDELTDSFKAKNPKEFFQALREWLRPEASSEENARQELADARFKAMRLLLDLRYAKQEVALYGLNEAIENTVLRLDPIDVAAALRRVEAQLQIMERAVRELRLNDPRNLRHSRNRGWMNLFRRWSQYGEFRRYWPWLIGYYSGQLQTFCIYALCLLPEITWKSTNESNLSPAERKSYEAIKEQSKEELSYTLHRARMASRALNGRSEEAEELKPPVGLAVTARGFQSNSDKEVLMLLRVQDTYRAMQLTQPLLSGLKSQMVRYYHVPICKTEASLLLERALRRAGYEPLSTATNSQSLTTS